MVTCPYFVSQNTSLHLVYLKTTIWALSVNDQYQDPLGQGLLVLTWRLQFSPIGCLQSCDWIDVLNSDTGLDDIEESPDCANVECYERYKQRSEHDPEVMKRCDF